MSIPTSPLRYPGGKTCLVSPVSQILRLNRLNQGHYAEPYAGGCGLALALLFGGHVSDIHVNDVDRAIWSFWHCVLHETDALVELIRRTPINLHQWHKQRALQKENRPRRLDLAFSTLFLNRTNRSGIIKNAGVIGGLSQSGPYLIDCRFNKEEIVRRIERIAKYRNRIHLHHYDALDFIAHVKADLPRETFLCIDPPYYNKGSSLYTSFYDPADHEDVAIEILKLKNPWILTYDSCDEVRWLYSSRRQFEFSLQYSAQIKRTGLELMIAAKGLKMPEVLRSSQIHRPTRRAA